MGLFLGSHWQSWASPIILYSTKFLNCTTCRLSTSDLVLAFNFMSLIPFTWSLLLWCRSSADFCQFLGPFVNGFNFPVDLQKLQVMTFSDSVTMSHGNSPSQDGRNFFAWRLFCIVFRVWLFFHWRWSSRSPGRKILMYTSLTLFLPQPLAFKLVPSPCCSHYGQCHNSVDNWIWSGYDHKYSSLLQQRMIYNACVVVLAHFSHIWERVLTYFSMISIIRLFIFSETFILAILLSNFLAFLGDSFNFFCVSFFVFCQNCASLTRICA